MSTPVGPRPEPRSAQDVVDSHWLRKKLIHAEESGAHVMVAMPGFMLGGRVENVDALGRCLLRNEQTSMLWYIPISNVLAVGIG